MLIKLLQLLFQIFARNRGAGQSDGFNEISICYVSFSKKEEFVIIIL